MIWSCCSLVAGRSVEPYRSVQECRRIRDKRHSCLYRQTVDAHKTEVLVAVMNGIVGDVTLSDKQPRLAHLCAR